MNDFGPKRPMSEDALCESTDTVKAKRGRPKKKPDYPAMIYVINRENIKWLVEYYEKNGMRWDFGMVVIDELSSFKNYQSQRFIGKWPCYLTGSE